MSDEEIEDLAIDRYPIYPIRPTPLDWIMYVDLQRAIFISAFKEGMSVAKAETNATKGNL